MNFDMNTLLPLLLMNGKNANNEQTLSMIKLLSNTNLFQSANGCGNNNANNITTQNISQNAKTNSNPFEQLFKNGQNPLFNMFANNTKGAQMNFATLLPFLTQMLAKDGKVPSMPFQTPEKANVNAFSKINFAGKDVLRIMNVLYKAKT